MIRLEVDTGLSHKQEVEIERVLASSPQVEKAMLIGSRAMGNFKSGSDVDIVLSGTGLESQTVRVVADQLNEETNIPFFFDILDLSQIRNEELLKHIEEHGITIYEKG
jgi:predicted nucleotidyltransferase